MKKLLLLVCVVLVTAFAQAATLRYMGSGDYMDGTKWTMDNVNPYGLPQVADTIRANWGGGTITLSQVAPNAIYRFQLGVDESGTLQVNAGGSLTTTSGSKVGNNNACTGTLIINEGGTVTVQNNWLMVAGSSLVTGIVDINGGTLNIGTHLWTTTGAGSNATININSGGVINVGGIIGLGSVDFAAGGGATLLNVNDGGLLALNNIHGDGMSSIKNGSLIDILGTGRITLQGDFVGVINSYAANSLIAGNGILGNVQAVFADGITTVTAVPEPASLAILGLGVMALIRKRK